MASDDKALVRSDEFLTPREAHALRYFKSAKQAEIAPSKAAEMYELFINGKDCEEIRKLNSGFSLGQIVHARVRDDWDLKRDGHQQRLVETVVPQVMQTQMEASLFVKDLLAAAIKLHWEKIQRYLQDGNEIHLKGTPLEGGATLKQIRDIIDTLQAATGQDKKKVVEHRGGVTVTSKRVNQDEAAQYLEVLAVETKKE